MLDVVQKRNIKIFSYLEAAVQVFLAAGLAGGIPCQQGNIYIDKDKGCIYWPKGICFTHDDDTNKR